MGEVFVSFASKMVKIESTIEMSFRLHKYGNNCYKEYTFFWNF